MIITFMVCLYFLLLSLSYIQYNNLANTISQNLNMRQNGYTEFSLIQKPVFNFSSGSSGIYGDDNISISNNEKQFINGTNKTIDSSDMNITTNGNYSVLKTGYYFINKLKSKFYMPGCRVTLVTINIYKNSAPDKTFPQDRSSGSLIEITIHYSCFGIPLKGVGYNIIT